MPAMPSYAAFLGNHPSISCAELSATIPDFQLKKLLGNSIAVFESALPLSSKDLKKWGGVFLLAEQSETKARSTDDIVHVLVKEVEGLHGKVTFSLRAFGIARPTLHTLYRECKKALKKVGKPARYIGTERKPPVSALLLDSGVIDGKHGRELVVLADEEKDFFWVGVSVAVQNPHHYTKLDMEKPVRDTRVGLLPPKLAQILLNLGLWMTSTTKDKKQETRNKLTIFDPFCGTGVIPMEALLRGWNVHASDVSLKAVHGCEKNIEWIRKEWKILKRDAESRVSKQDATKPFDAALREHTNVIVTETTLGPALSNRPTVRDAVKIRTECDATELAFLKNAAATMPGVPIVATWPVWYVSTGPVFLEKVWKQLGDLGYKAVLPPAIRTDNPGRTSLLYRRAEQIVGREIVLLRPLS